MNTTLTIAALTVKEAVRRRLLVAFVGITVAMVALSAWGFNRLSLNPRASSSSDA
jgi:hypothetical protein